MTEMAGGEGPEIVIDRLYHAFGRLPVVEGISVRIEPGEIVAVLGPSGCGKTTLLRLVGGLVLPTSGSIRLGSGLNEGLVITYVFQEPTLLPWRSVAGNVALPLEHTRGSPRDRERRVAEALARVKLSEFAQVYPRSLSGGMNQRVSIARALVVGPAVLLMDEPLGSLDELTRDLLLADLVRIWGETPYTCLYVTHSPSEAVLIAHRVVILTARPARIREIIPINLAIDKRSESHPTIVAARDRIRELIRMPR